MAIRKSYEWLLLIALIELKVAVMLSDHFETLKRTFE